MASNPARRMALLLVAAVALAALLAAPSVAMAGPGAATRTEITRAVRLVSKIGPSHFARGQRRVVLAAGRAAVRSQHGRHSACRVLAGADKLLALLELPTTWAHRRVPVKVVKAPVGLLRAAEKRLIRQADARCAASERKTRVIKPLKGGRGLRPLPPPTEQPEQGRVPRIAVGHFRPVKVIGTRSSFRSGPFKGSPGDGSPAGTGRASAAHAPANPGQLAFFRFADAGIPVRSASPQEPTAAIGGNVVWYTGNTSVALSTNAGRTFAMFNPSKFLPDGGLPFCCDQVVSYSPQYNIFVWVMQYWCAAGASNPATNSCNAVGTGANRVRIAVASPQTLISHAANPGAAWTYWNLTPQLFGQPATAWFDRSDLSVSIWNANWTVDILRGNKGVGSLLARISLQQLASRGTITIGYITDTQARQTIAQGPQTTTYYVATDSLSQQRIWSWEAFSGTLFRHDISHTTVPNLNAAMTGTDAADWYDRYGIFPGAVESATVSGSTLYVAQGTGRSYCTANCSGPNPTLRQVFTQPAVFISKYDVNSWTEAGERWLWNPTYGLGWPALQTDGAGDVGIALRAAPSGQNAQPVAGLLTPSEQFVLALPAGLPHETGDYYSLRPGRTARSFVMTAQTVQNDNGAINMHWQYIEYGTGQPPSISPPTVIITSPANGESVTQGDSLTYSASVTDPLDGTLPSAAIVWREDGTKVGTGTVTTNVENTLGVHTIAVTATNAEGKSATASTTIHVTSPPGPIVVNITSPPNGSQVLVQNQVKDSNGNYCGPVSFTATASGGAGPLSYTWIDTISGNITSGATVVSNDLSPTLTLCAGPFPTNARSTHSLELSVTDGLTTSDAFVTIDVITPEIT